MRLDKLLSHACGWTRSSTAKAIRRGNLEVNGVRIKDPAAQVSPDTDVITFEGEPVLYESRVVLMMHKPTGVVCATEDPNERTVLDVLDERHHRHDLRIVGRLDKDTTGLLLLTTDGDLLHRLTHPRHETPKCYVADYAGELSSPEARFAAGLTLEDDTVCKPASFEPLGPARARITITEGKYHQVRRMVAACGGHVVRLHRETLGSLQLDPALAPGDARKLTADELALIDAP